MARLLTVVNERKKLRNEYRRHLEDEYIAKKKEEEQAAIKAENDKLREQGIKAPLTQEEVKEVLAKKAAKKKENLEASFESLKQKFEKEDSATSPLISESDLRLISTAQTNLSQGDILRMYVKNWAELDLKQRRKVMGHI